MRELVIVDVGKAARKEPPTGVLELLLTLTRGGLCRGWTPKLKPATLAAMNEFGPLIDQLYREEILHARKMTPQQRIAAAFEFAPMAYEFMYAGIRRQHPDADDAELLRLARERIAKVRRMHEAKIYRPVEPPR